MFILRVCIEQELVPDFKRMNNAKICSGISRTSTALAVLDVTNSKPANNIDHEEDLRQLKIRRSWGDFNFSPFNTIIVLSHIADVFQTGLFGSTALRFEFCLAGLTICIS